MDATLIPELQETRINKRSLSGLRTPQRKEPIFGSPVAQCGRAAETFGLFLSHSSDVKVQRLILQKQAPPPSSLGMCKHSAEEPSHTYVRQEECVRALKGETSDRRSSAVTMRSQHHCHWFSLSGLQMHRRWQICMLNQHLTGFGAFLLLFLHYNNKSKFTKQAYTVCVSN